MLSNLNSVKSGLQSKTGHAQAGHSIDMEQVAERFLKIPTAQSSEMILREEKNLKGSFRTF